MKELGYGNFPGGDPRQFAPDSDSRPEELEAWRAACEEAMSREADGEEADLEPACRAIPGVGFVTYSFFGLGSYLYECEDNDEDNLSRITAAEMGEVKSGERS